jgi:hypothetical protein
LGLDAGRQGDDPSVIAAVQGATAWFPPNGTLHQKDGVAVAKRLAFVAKELGAVTASIDGGGLGAGPIDIAREMQRIGEFPRTCEIIEVQFGSRPSEVNQYANRRAELWWTMREWLRTTAAFDVPDDLQEELVIPTFEIRGTRIKLEEKEAIKRRLGRSTNFGDALALAVSGHTDPVGAADVFFV